jgi:hypothetical protein
MKALAGAALVALLLLSGCFGSGSTSSSGTTSSTGFSKATTSASLPPTTTQGPTSATSTPTTGTTSSSSSGPTPNRAPTATLVASQGTGAVPLNVTFTLSGSDPDGDPMSYRLAFGDGAADATGTALPATVRHNFTLVGNFTVRLTVRDAAHTANATLVIHATKAAAAPATILQGDVQTDCLAKCEGCVTPTACAPPAAQGAKGCGSFVGGNKGVDCTYWPVANVAGKTFVLHSSGDPDGQFFDTCDAKDGKPLGDMGAIGDDTGTIPAGTGCIVAWEYKAVDPGKKITITFAYS